MSDEEVKKWFHIVDENEAKFRNKVLRILEAEGVIGLTPEFVDKLIRAVHEADEAEEKE